MPVRQFIEIFYSMVMSNHDPKIFGTNMLFIAGADNGPFKKHI